MPLYEYKCHSCGKTFEVLQKFSDEPVKVHEGCGGDVERLISRSAFQLKGSGWYATDYAKPNGGGATKDDSKASGDKSGDSKESSKTETKPAETKTPETKSTPAPAANPPA
ncbi:MAG TPA: zinc ribbon domain-containing protein [Bryobacteraceae bacterium]|nr:zinc ribbon domain-containing protein [Bryobacteraceae bacterium]